MTSWSAEPNAEFGEISSYFRSKNNRPDFIFKIKSVFKTLISLGWIGCWTWIRYDTLYIIISLLIVLFLSVISLASFFHLITIFCLCQHRRRRCFKWIWSIKSGWMNKKWVLLNGGKCGRTLAMKSYFSVFGNRMHACTTPGSDKMNAVCLFVLLFKSLRFVKSCLSHYVFK